jgi:hypothetical protein
MKTTTTTTTTTLSKTSLRARSLALLLATLAVAFAPDWAAATGEVPFKGSAEGAVISLTPGPEGALLVVLAEGQATHLGKFTREEMLILNPATGTIAGTVVFTAANGDQLIGGVTGQFTSPTTVVGTYTFTGGTGRFENAVGEAAFSLATPDGTHFTVEFDGTLSALGQ